MRRESTPPSDRPSEPTSAVPSGDACACTSPPDWSLAAALVQRYPRPALVLDRRGRIRLANRGIGEALGMPHESLVGQDWLDVLAPSQEWGRRASAALSRLFEESRDEAELRDAGADRRFLAHLFVVERDTGIALVELRHPGSVRPWPPGYEQHLLEIDTRSESFGTVLWSRSVLPSGSEVIAAGERCHQKLFGHSAPCRDCPVRQGDDEHALSRAVVRRPGGYFVINLRAQWPTSAVVSLSSLDDEVVPELIEARLEALADDAGLSPRERRVFELLALGRTHDEIADVLEITVRTVKFHQANVLERLGADSRTDLLRLLL